MAKLGCHGWKVLLLNWLSVPFGASNENSLRFSFLFWKRGVIHYTSIRLTDIVGLGGDFFGFCFCFLRIKNLWQQSAK